MKNKIHYIIKLSVLSSYHSNMFKCFIFYFIIFILNILIIYCKNINADIILCNNDIFNFLKPMSPMYYFNINSKLILLKSEEVNNNYVKK